MFFGFLFLKWALCLLLWRMICAKAQNEWEVYEIIDEGMSGSTPYQIPRLSTFYPNIYVRYVKIFELLFEVNYSFFSILSVLVPEKSTQKKVKIYIFTFFIVLLLQSLTK